VTWRALVGALIISIPVCTCVDIVAGYKSYSAEIAEFDEVRVVENIIVIDRPYQEVGFLPHKEIQNVKEVKRIAQGPESLFPLSEKSEGRHTLVDQGCRQGTVGETNRRAAFIERKIYWESDNHALDIEGGGRTNIFENHSPFPRIDIRGEFFDFDIGAQLVSFGFLRNLNLPLSGVGFPARFSSGSAAFLEGAVRNLNVSDDAPKSGGSEEESENGDYGLSTPVTPFYAAMLLLLGVPILVWAVFAGRIVFAIVAYVMVSFGAWGFICRWLI
jgi:hypothetical protein